MNNKIIQQSLKFSYAKSIILLLIAFSFLLPKVHAQAPSIEWQKTINGAQDVQQTSDGGYVAVGYSNSSFTNWTNKGQNDAWITKYNASGVLQWQKFFGDTLNDKFMFVQPTTDGGYIIGGQIDSLTNKTRDSRRITESNIWVVKLNAQGSMLWQRRLNFNREQHSLVGIKQTKDGGFALHCSIGYVASRSSSTIDGLVVKLFPSGNDQWKWLFTSGVYGQLRHLFENEKGDYILVTTIGVILKLTNAGIPTSYLTSPIQPTILTNGRSLLKVILLSNGKFAAIAFKDGGTFCVIYDSAGIMESERKIFDANFSINTISALELTKDNGYVFTCSVLNYSNNNNIDCFIVKLSSFGDIQWKYNGCASTVKPTKDNGYIITTNGGIAKLRPSTSSPTFDANKCYRLVNKATNKVLEVKDASQSEGAQIYQWTSANNRPQQTWQIKTLSSGQAHIIAKISNKLMTASACAEGAIINQAALTGSTRQNWTLQLQTDGSYKIFSERCSMSLRVSGSSTADGASVGVRTDYGGDNFKWLLQEATCPTPNSALSTNETFAFEAQAVEGRAQLQWVTKGMDNIDYFAIERMDEKGNFDVLDKQNSYPNSTELQSYTFTDNNSLEGDNFYRITTYSNLSPPQYSEVKKVSFAKTTDIGLFPNPASDYIDLDLRQYEGKAVSLSFYNAVGTFVQNIKIAKAVSAPQRIDIQGFNTGAYLIRLQVEGKKEITKLFNVAK